MPYAVCPLVVFGMSYASKTWTYSFEFVSMFSAHYIIVKEDSKCKGKSLMHSSQNLYIRTTNFPMHQKDQPNNSQKKKKKENLPYVFPLCIMRSFSLWSLFTSSHWAPFIPSSAIDEQPQSFLVDLVLLILSSSSASMFAWLLYYYCRVSAIDWLDYMCMERIISFLYLLKCVRHIVASKLQAVSTQFLLLFSWISYCKHKSIDIPFPLMSMPALTLQFVWFAVSYSAPTTTISILF